MSKKNIVIIIAHPDDETLWVGGTLLRKNIAWNCFIVCLCRGMDEDRAPKFKQALQLLEVQGIMNDLDDGAEQLPLENKRLEEAIVSSIPTGTIDLIITHSPMGEYTRHRRHEEIGKAVIKLWKTDKIHTKSLWLFAYEDGKGAHYPRAVIGADHYFPLHEKIVFSKREILMKTYGFQPDSWEVLACPNSEAFWSFSKPEKAFKWLHQLQLKS